MTIDSLLRGQAYHLTFIDKTIDAILIDVDYTSTHTAETITLFCIDDTQGVSSESMSVSASDFIEAEPLHMDNSSIIEKMIEEVMTEFDHLLQTTDKRVDSFEDDAVDGIEQREDESCALFYLQMFTQYDYKKALIYSLNSMPYLLKRKPQNKLAYKVLLYAIVKSASDDANEIIKLPIFPNQFDLYAEDNVTMLRKMAYQLMYNFNSVSLGILTGARRFRGYIKNYQSYNSRGLVLFADERNMLSFSDVNIMDLRLVELLKSGLSEVGRIEIEFSLGYIPKEGGTQVTTFVCTRISLSAASIECCRALGRELPEEFSRYEGYKETPICPTSYYPIDSYIGISRIFREESFTISASGEKKGLLNPMGTQTGYILQWSCIPRKNGNGIDVWEGELGCNGNIIHFNLFQVYENSLKQFLTNSPDQAIGIEVKFEPAFNAGKNRIAIWADVIRTMECNLEIPPEYNQEIPWSVERSQQEWTPPAGVTDTYRVLQPWLPVFNPFLENCHVGKLDMNYLSSSQSFSEGRINLSSAQNAIWYSFPTSSIHERYLKNILMSALCYKVCSTAPTDNTAFEISVIFNLQPSSKPGRYMADNIILMPVSRGTIWNRCEKKYNCPVNRSGNILLEMADSYLPLQLKGKPFHIQRNYVNNFGNPDIFRPDVEYSGQITKMFLNDAGIIVDSLTGSEIQFRSEQIYEEGLLERAKNAFATNRYAGVLVKFQKKQALLDKSVVAIKADCIYSRDLEKKDVPIRTEYKALCDDESQLQKKAVSFRKGFLVDYRRTNEGIVCRLCDEHPTVWADDNDEQVVFSHYSFNVDRISDGRLRYAIEMGIINKQIPVVFNLIKLTESDAADGSTIQPDNVHITEETAQEYGLTATEEYSFVPEKGILTNGDITNAEYYEGKVTTNESSTRIWIEIEEHDKKPLYLVNNQIRELSRINTSCTSSDTRQYVLEIALREQLIKGETGMKICFIPIKPVNNYYNFPQAGYMTYTPDERIRQNISPIRYYPSFVPQAYMPSFDFDSLLYNKAENNYDKLIRGKISNINGDYKEAAALFMEGKPSQGHTIMQQKGEMPDGHLEGLRLVPSKEKRIAYADALIRNRDLVFDNYNKLLNAIADLLCARREVIDWEHEFDRDAYRIMLQYKKAMEQFGIHEQMILRVKNAIAQMEIARDASNGGSSAAAVSSGNHQAISSQASTSPATRNVAISASLPITQTNPSSQASTPPVTRNAAIPTSLPIMEKVPFLKHIIEQRESSALTQRRILVDVMNNAERLLRDANYLGNVSQNRLDAAAYYYGIILRDNWEGTPDASYDFARRAMSFAVLPYSEFQDMISFMRRDAVLWQTLSLRENIQLLPQTNNDRMQMTHYLHLLMQTACLSNHVFFMQPESEMLFANGNPWSQAFRSLCNSMNIPFAGDLGAILQSYKNSMKNFEQSLPRADKKAQSLSDSIRSFTLLGNRFMSGTPIHRCSQQAAKFRWAQDPRVAAATQEEAKTILDAYLNSLEQLSSGASNEKTSMQINAFADVLASLKNIRNWIIQEPTILTAEYILPCVESYIACLETILGQLFLTRHDLKMEAQMGSINETARIFTVPVSIACDQESSSCRNIRVSVVSVTGAGLQAQRNNIVIHSIESGETSVVEMRFRIRENVNDFRNMQTISIGLRLDYDAFRFSDGKLVSYSDHVSKPLDCPIQQAQYDIDNGAFNSQSTQYNEKLFFVGREDEIKKMENALYDPKEKTFNYGVGIIIYGQRRSGKSWLAGKLCSELKKKEALQAPIICDKIDITGSVDLMTDIINKIVNAMPENDRDLAQAALDYAKPFSMLDVVEKALRLHKAKNEEVDFDELLSSLETVKDGLRKISATEYASFPTFYYELERKYTERHGMPLPPITIVLDEFTAIYDKIMAGSITLSETLSIVKLIESYCVNVILICADHYKSVLAAIDDNAFTHYKTEVEVTGLSVPEANEMICRPLKATRRGGTADENRQPQNADENERPKSRIDEEAARHLHSLYNGNVFLLTMACEKVVEHMNTCGYLSMSDRQLNTFERDLLVSTMTMRSMEAYIVDGRFLEHKIASFVLTRLNIIAISTIAHLGTQGVALYSDVMNAVKAEYQKLLIQEDMSHFVDLLNANGKEGKISDRDMVIEREYAMERISAENVLDWLVERKVLYKGSSANNEVTLELKLLAYIKASEIPNSECYQMEELSPHAQNSAENPIPNVDLSAFDHDDDDDDAEE